MERPFQRYQRGVVGIMAWRTTAVMTALSPLLVLLIQWCGLDAAIAVWMALSLAWLLEFGILTGNRGLRRAVADRLRGFGRTVDTGRDRFVGLAWPCFYGHARRQVETDDDVGFLAVDARGLVFIGDSLEFVIPAQQIAGVRLVRDANTAFLTNRVAVDTRDGEPQDTVVFDSRDRGMHSACNRDNRRLLAEIRAIMVAPQLAVAPRQLAQSDAEELPVDAR